MQNACGPVTHSELALHLARGHSQSDTVHIWCAGALALPDIGQIFRDNDPKWKGASSDIFVKEACKLLRERGYAIGNIDCTIIAQKPKLSPHKEDIRCRSHHAVRWPPCLACAQACAGNTVVP
jgi:2-C-methyl-D-erythritol 2,4-cyclodiphosphate synthase